MSCHRGSPSAHRFKEPYVGTNPTPRSVTTGNRVLSREDLMMRPSRWLLLLTLALSACGSAPDETSCSVQVYLDQDGDGFGDPEALLESCQAEVPGYVSNNADCDDSSALVSPDAVELCDQVDNNCDGETDEGFQINTWYPDLDEDGFGDDASGVSTCSAPPNLILQGGDCDDLDPEVNPDRPEVCDGIDNDCDNNIDDADPDLIAASTLPFWPDTDADGYGDFAASAVNACEAPAGHIDNREDCDDTLPAVNPGGVEVCDGLDSDENCNGLVDDADPTVDPASLGSYWLDADGDGWGDPNVLASACDSPAGHVPNDLDCDDSSALLGDSADWWLDQDADGYGAGLPISACSAPGPDYVLHPLADCNDGDPATHPGAFDLCGDGVDSDCSGLDAGCAQPIVGVYDLDTPDWEYAATSGNEQTGFDIGVVDLNLDGARDLLVGSPAASTARVHSRDDPGPKDRRG